MKTKKNVSQPLPFTSLPDEIIENCFGRISRWNYPSLSLVCKKFRSLLSCTELYKTRSQIGTIETYVCLQLPDHPCPSWFSLWEKPSQTRGRKKITFKKKSSGNLLVPIPSSSSPSPPAVPYNSTVPVIGGAYVGGPSSAVWILDCLSHTWRDGPGMNVARGHASANYLDEKIYVIGGCKIDEFATNWMEVLDIKTQSWTAFPCPCDHEELSEGVLDCEFKGKLHVVADTKEYTFESKEGVWKVVRESSSFRSVDFNCWCVVENVIYCCTSSNHCMWYDFAGGKWEVVMGLEELREHRTKGLSNGNVLCMSDRGENLLVIWEPKPKSGRTRSGNEIWYAEISLEKKCNAREIWGKIEWADAMLTVPRMPYYDLWICLPVSV